MEIKFHKMHGAGNDFIIVDNRKNLAVDFSRLAPKICARRTGIGADGILLLEEESNIFRMRIYNADGSEAEMCGNGLRCLAAFIYEQQLTGKKEFPVLTGAGIRYPKIRESGGKVEAVTVDMGSPSYAAEKISFLKVDGIDEKLATNIQVRRVETLRQAHWVIHLQPPGHDEPIIFFPISMGNPHLVGMIKDVEHYPVNRVGPWIEKLPIFPFGVNVEFIEILEDNKIKARVWERGVGETLACGTGACAIGVFNFLFGRGKQEKEQNIQLPGGNLQVYFAQGRIQLTGPVAYVYKGSYMLKEG